MQINVTEFVAPDQFSLVNNFVVNSDVFKWAFVKTKRQVIFFHKHFIKTKHAPVNNRLTLIIDIFFPESSCNLFSNLSLQV